MHSVGTVFDCGARGGTIESVPVVRLLRRAGLVEGRHQGAARGGGREALRVRGGEGKAVTGRVMKLGVQVGGTPYLPTSYRWAYGWPFLRGYARRSPEEARVVNDKGKDYEKARKARCG